MILEIVRAADADAAGDGGWADALAFDGGEDGDVLPKVLSRVPLFGGEPNLGGSPSIGRSITAIDGQDEESATIRTAMERELSALDTAPSAIRELDAVYVESVELIDELRRTARQRGIADFDNAFEGCRNILLAASGLIRKQAPDQFPPPVVQSPGGSPGSAGVSSGGVGSAPEAAGSEDGFLAVRDRKLRELEALGAWFRRFEPHNPVGHVVPELTRRARLDLPGLIADLFDAANVDKKDLGRVNRILGLVEPVAASSTGG